MLSVVLYIGPLFFLFIGHMFFVCILLYSFIPLKHAVKHVSCHGDGVMMGPSGLEVKTPQGVIHS
jgi:hypothetical protein